MPPATFPITNNNGISFHPKGNCNNLLSVITLDVFYGRRPPQARLSCHNRKSVATLNRTATKFTAVFAVGSVIKYCDRGVARIETEFIRPSYHNNANQTLTFPPDFQQLDCAVMNWTTTELNWNGRMC